MCEECNNVLSTSGEADKISCFGRYQYISKTQISARQYIGLSLNTTLKTIFNTYQYKQHLQQPDLSLTNIKLNCIACRSRFLQSALIAIHYYVKIML